MKKRSRNVRENDDLKPRARPCHNHARTAGASTRDDADDTSPSSSTTMASVPSDTSTDTGETSAGGFLSLPLHLISTNILTSDFLPEPGDLRSLRAVSKYMRNAVKETGREIRRLSDEEAAELGYLSLLKDRHSRGLLPDWPLLCAAAARNGDLEMLKALRADDCPWDARTCAYAAEGGHLEVLKWARENECPWDADTCAGAACRGHLDILKWARENECPWDEDTCEFAAEGGHLEVLKWARENGCPWDVNTCRRAAAEGHLEVLKWARANGAPEPQEDTDDGEDVDFESDEDDVVD
jgi:hypothetical protein